MAFQKSEKYFETKISNIQRAIKGTIESLREYEAEGDQRAIDAHEAQIESYTKDLKEAYAERAAWVAKHQICQDCGRPLAVCVGEYGSRSCFRHN